MPAAGLTRQNGGAYLTPHAWGELPFRDGCGGLLHLGAGRLQQQRHQAGHGRGQRPGADRGEGSGGRAGRRWRARRHRGQACAQGARDRSARRHLGPDPDPTVLRASGQRRRAARTAVVPGASALPPAGDAARPPLPALHRRGDRGPRPARGTRAAADPGKRLPPGHRIALRRGRPVAVHGRHRDQVRTRREPLVRRTHGRRPLDERRPQLPGRAPRPFQRRLADCRLPPTTPAGAISNAC